MIEINRKTKETDIMVKLDMGQTGTWETNTTVPFFDHMLHAMAFHGRFSLVVHAKGDTAVDPHHLVEDTGIVIGNALWKSFQQSDGIARYGHAVIPMDDALGEAVVDVCGRPYCVYAAKWPQDRVGNFDIHLLREFWWGLATKAKINLHLHSRYAENSHHAAEAMFKAAGRSLSQAFKPIGGGEQAMSTKGSL